MAKDSQSLVEKIGINVGRYRARDVVRTLAGSIRDYKLPSLISPIFVIGEVVIECILPFVTANLIDAIHSGAGMPVIYHYSFLLILMAVLSLICGAIAGIACSVASAGLAKNLRHDMFERIQNFSFSNIDRFSTPSLVTRMTTDVMNVQQAYMMIIRTAIRSPLMIISAIVMAFVTAGPMALIYIVIAAFLAIALFLIGIKTMPIFIRVFRKYDHVNDTVEENVSGMRVVKSYVREAYEKKKFDAASEDLYKDFVHAERILAWNDPVMTFAADALFVFVIYFGSRAIVLSKGAILQVGSLAALVTYGISILMSLMMLSMIFVMITLSAESAERITQVLKETPDISNPDNPLMTIPDGSIDFDHVSFEYSTKSESMALSNIDLHIKSGEVIGIIGGTGSSKSTLIQLISRLYDATAGTVKVGGNDVRRYDLEALRNAVAVVLQRNVLFSGTIKDNLRWGDENASDEEMRQVCEIAQADEFIQRFPEKYDTYIEQGGSNVSGGQKQRLCIARALLKHPKVLIMDDSTSAVDTKTDRKIREGLKNYAPDTTKIIIAQRTSSVEDADRILVMDDGQIKDIGTHEELLKTSEIYRDIYITQNKQSHDDKIRAEKIGEED